MSLIPHDKGLTIHDCVTQEGELNLQSSGELWITAWHPNEYGSDNNLSLYFKVDRERSLLLARKIIQQNKEALFGELSLSLKDKEFVLLDRLLEIVDRGTNSD